MDEVDRLELEALQGVHTKRDDEHVDAALRRFGIVDDHDEDVVEYDNQTELVLNEDSRVV